MAWRDAKRTLNALSLRGKIVFVAQVIGVTVTIMLLFIVVVRLASGGNDQIPSRTRIAKFQTKFQSRDSCTLQLQTLVKYEVANDETFKRENSAGILDVGRFIRHRDLSLDDIFSRKDPSSFILDEAIAETLGVYILDSSWANVNFVYRLEEDNYRSRAAEALEIERLLSGARMDSTAAVNAARNDEIEFKRELKMFQTLGEKYLTLLRMAAVDSLTQKNRIIFSESSTPILFNTNNAGYINWIDESERGFTSAKFKTARRQATAIETGATRHVSQIQLRTSALDPEFYLKWRALKALMRIRGSTIVMDVDRIIDSANNTVSFSSDSLW